jgi:hypothetical protein
LRDKPGLQDDNAQKLGMPEEGDGGKASGAEHVEANGSGSRLGEGEINGGGLAGGESGEWRFVEFDGKVGGSIGDGPELVIIEGVGGDLSAGTNGDVEGGKLRSDDERVDGAGFGAEDFVGGLGNAEEINHAMDALLHGAEAAIAFVGAVIVVTEKDEAADEILLAEDGVVGAKDFAAAGIVFGAFGDASAVAVLGDDKRLGGKGFVDGVKDGVERFESAGTPGADVLVHFDEIHQSGDIFGGSLFESVGSVRAETMRVEALGFGEKRFGELKSRRILAIDFVAETPGKDGGVIAIAGNHFAKLIETVEEYVGVGPGGHALKSVGTPGGNFGLDEDAMAVAEIENASILGPMGAGEDTVEIFQIAMIVFDPIGGLGHAVIRIAAGHALDAGELNALTIEVEGGVFDFELADAEDDGEGVGRRGLLGRGVRVRVGLREDGVEAVEVRMIEVPKFGMGEGESERSGGFGKRGDGDGCVRRKIECGEAGVEIADAEGEHAVERRGGSVPGEEGDVQFGGCGGGGEVGQGIHIDAVEIDLGCDEQLDGAVDAAIEGPVTGMITGEHVRVEGIVDEDGEGVGLAGEKERGDVEGKCSVGLAEMLAGELSIDPDFRGVVNGFELDAHDGILP